MPNVLLKRRFLRTKEHSSFLGIFFEKKNILFADKRYYLWKNKEYSVIWRMVLNFSRIFYIISHVKCFTGSTYFTTMHWQLSTWFFSWKNILFIRGTFFGLKNILLIKEHLRFWQCLFRKNILQEQFLRTFFRNDVPLYTTGRQFNSNYCVLKNGPNIGQKLA